MHRERELELIGRLMDPDAPVPGPLGDHSMQNAALAYTCPDRFEREREILFQGRPNLIGLSTECAETGDYLTGNLGGIPIFVVRGQDGAIRGFVNACRHRGSRLLEGRGNVESAVSCFYHGWRYALDGTLKSRPGAEPGFDDIPRETLCLHAIDVHEQYGLIFARPAGKGSFTVDEALSGAEEELASYGLEDYCHIDTREFDVAFNWKLVIDTFTEPYHIPWLHKDTIAGDYFFNRWVFDAYGPHGRFVGVRKSIEAEFAKTDPNERRFLPHGTTQYLLVPNAVLCHQIDHVELWRLTPLGVDKTRVATSIFAPRPPQTDKEQRYWLKNLDALLKVTTTEDFPAMQQIHENLASGALPNVVYGKMEPALVHLHESLNALLDQG